MHGRITSGIERFRSRSPARRAALPSALMFVLGLVVAAIAGTAVATAGQRAEDHDTVVQGITDIFSSGTCMTADQATRAIEETLLADAADGWTITRRVGALETACVTAGIVAPDKTIVLLPTAGADIRVVMGEVGRQLLADCLDEDQARALIGSVLAGVSSADWVVRSDGPLAYPIGQGEEVKSHINAGCFVYSGSGRDEDGRPVYFINGPSR